jgi:hypothetical protein
MSSSLVYSRVEVAADAVRPARLREANEADIKCRMNMEEKLSYLLERKFLSLKIHLKMSDGVGIIYE